VLASYKLRIRDRHVRAVPATNPDGSPFTGPGVDLRGEDADRAIAAAAPIFAWLEAREPGVRVRSISVRTSEPRVLISLESDTPDGRPRALRFEPPSSFELRDAGRDAEAAIEEACARVVAQRPFR
jgi:hypothetical protein